MATIPMLQHDMCSTDAQCWNGGHCQIFKRGQVKSGPNDDYNYCICPPGYGGQRCESSCPLICLHSGVCHANGIHGSIPTDPNYPLSSNYACKCLGYWTGTVCDIPYTNCGDGSQCYHQGKCREKKKDNTSVAANSSSISSSSYYCECPQGYGGTSCLDEVTESADAGFVATKKTTAIFSVATALAIAASIIGLTCFLYRRRRKTKQPSYATVEASDGVVFQYEIETSNRRVKQEEKWRNVV